MARLGIHQLRRPPKKYRPDLAQPPPGKKHFETRADARREEELRRKALRKAARGLLRRASNVQTANDLARRLNGRGDHPSMASPVCMREQRIRIIGHLHRLIKMTAGSSERLFDIIPRGWRVRRRDLLRFNVRARLSAFRSALNRERTALRRENARVGRPNNPDAGWLIMFVHGDWDVRAERYQLHVHGVASGEMVEVVRRLGTRRNFKSAHTGEESAWSRVIVKAQAPTDLPYPLTYRLKSYWLATPSYVNAEGRVRRSPQQRRLVEPQHTQVLFWMDQWRLQDICLMMGIQVTRKGLTPTYPLSDAYTNRKRS